MPTLRLLCAAAVVACLPACDKARELGGKVKAAIRDEARGPHAVDPSLAALIDRTEQGAVFRNDLPFPRQLDVRVSREMVLDDARVLQQSALGNESTQTSGTLRMVGLYERSGQHVRLTMEKTTFAPPEAPPGKDGAPAGTSTSALAGMSLVFRNETGSWQADAHADFRASVWASELAPVFHTLIKEEGVMPRSRWLGQDRIRPGDEIPLAGPALAALFDGATGRVVLKLESFANAPRGHPCGVFSLTGDYQRRGAATADGEKRDEDVSILSGEVWLSLVYPLVLREDLETVQTMVTGAGGGPSSRIQGKVRMKTTREWTIKGSPDEGGA